jgi:hypothetical protein
MCLKIRCDEKSTVFFGKYFGSKLAPVDAGITWKPSGRPEQVRPEPRVCSVGETG